jgi:hypothetical protein
MTVEWNTAWSWFVGTSPLLAVLLGLHMQNRSVLKRMLSHYEDFPPHRHIAGKIVYPAKMEPQAPQVHG